MAEFVHRFRHGIHLQPELGGGLVHQVDGLVGQEAVGDVALGEFHGGDDGLVQNAHLVVRFVALAQAAEDGYGVLRVRFVHHHLLEAALEGLVPFEELLVLVERGGADGTEFAPGECRFQDVGGVHRALAAARAHEGVYFVYEEDDVAIAAGNLLDHGLEAFLELALVLCPGDQRAHVEGEDGLGLQVLGRVSLDDAVGDALGDGGFAHARLADQYGVVLRPAGEDLHHAADFLVPADDGVELPGFGVLVQVAGVLAQRVVGRLGVLACHAVVPAQFADGRFQVFFVHALVFQQGGRLVARGQDAQQKMLDGDKLVLELAEVALCLLEDGNQCVAGVNVSVPAGYLGQCLDLPVGLGGQMVQVGVEFLEQVAGHVFVHRQQRFEQVDRFDGLLPVADGDLGGFLHGLLSLYGEIVEVHGSLFSMITAI